LILDSTHIRITSLKGVDNRTAGGCRAQGMPQDCANTTFDAILTVPDTAKSGSWTLPHPEVTLLITREFPAGYSEVKRTCVCQPAIVAPREVTRGSIVLSTIQSPQFPDWKMTMELSDLSYPALSGSSIVTSCP
jgi:hypothetical protein